MASDPLPTLDPNAAPVVFVQTPPDGARWHVVVSRPGDARPLAMRPGHPDARAALAGALALANGHGYRFGGVRS